MACGSTVRGRRALPRLAVLLKLCLCCAARVARLDRRSVRGSTLPRFTRLAGALAAPDTSRIARRTRFDRQTRSSGLRAALCVLALFPQLIILSSSALLFRTLSGAFPCAPWSLPLALDDISFADAAELRVMLHAYACVCQRLCRTSR
jgi:hypothetical protein